MLICPRPAARPSSTWLLPLLAMVLTSGGCKEEAEPLTEIIVAVDSDWWDLSRVRIELIGFADDRVVNADVADHPWPMILPLIHEGGKLGPFEVRVLGYTEDGSSPAIVEPRAPINFVSGKSRALHVVLRAACVGQCDDDQACRLDDDDGHRCVDPEELSKLTPWQGAGNLPPITVKDPPEPEPDAAMPMPDGMVPDPDAGKDAGMDGGRDAGRDSGMDASMQPDAQLDAGEPDAKMEAGTCDLACEFTVATPHAIGRCVDNACVLTCVAGYADCDGDFDNGCEALLSEHCGPCQGLDLKRKALTLDGSAITGPLSDFPVPIVLGDAELMAAREDGADLCFTDGDGETPLAFEIEHWQRASGDLFAWVAMPSLATGTDATIYVYYGYDNAQRSADNPFQAYQGVWHMTDGSDGSPAGLDAVDAPAGNTPGDAAGKLGGALSFDGADDYVEVTSDALDQLFSGPATLETWFYAESFGEGSGMTTGSGYGRLLDKSDDTNPDGGWALYVRNDNNCMGTISFGHDVTGGTFGSPLIWCAPNNIISLETWHHVALVYDRNTDPDPLLYVDGQPVTFNLLSGNNSNNLANDGSSPMRIGQHASSTRRSFDGLLDEVRVSRVARSAAWLATQVATQTDPASVWTVGASETP